LEVLVDETDLGLLEVDHVWVNYIAAASEVDANAISVAWVKAMSEEDEVDVNDDIIGAVGDLISLCKTAKSNNVTVLHGWFL